MDRTVDRHDHSVGDSGDANGDTTGANEAEGDPATNRHERSGETDRSDRVTVHRRPGPENSLHRWYRARHPLRVAINYLVILICRISPSLVLKRVLLRRLGMQVGKGVAWGLESTPDVFWPELITVEDHVIIGYDATILCHEFLRQEYRTGEVVIREGAMIGAGAIVLPGVEIGENARVAANSLVAENVPPETTVAGVPAKIQSGVHSPDDSPSADNAAGHNSPDGNSPGENTPDGNSPGEPGTDESG